MTVDVVQLVIQAGALGLFALFLWKIFAPVINRMMDSLIQSTRVQAEMANNLQALCSRLDDGDVQQTRRNRKMEEAQTDITENLEQITACLRGLQQQAQAHEGRSAKRHEALLEHNRELVNVLKGMNGHAKEPAQ